MSPSSPCSSKVFPMGTGSREIGENSLIFMVGQPSSPGMMDFTFLLQSAQPSFGPMGPSGGVALQGCFTCWWWLTGVAIMMELLKELGGHELSNTCCCLWPFQFCPNGISINFWGNGFPLNTRQEIHGKKQPLLAILGLPQ